MSNPVFLCADLSEDRIVLDGPEGRHAALVKRMRVGETVDLVDGLGTRCTCVVVATGRETVTCDVAGRLVEPAPKPRLTLVQALAKGDRGELAVELATEVGVDEVIPWSAARCVVQWSGERGVKALERWRATAREASKQSRRAWFPLIQEAVQTAEIATLPGQLLLLHEGASQALSSVDLTGDAVLVVGPEGGIAPEELAALEAVGALAVRLGSSVLRTSTAGAVAVAVVSSRSGRW